MHGIPNCVKYPRHAADLLCDCHPWESRMWAEPTSLPSSPCWWSSGSNSYSVLGRSCFIEQWSVLLGNSWMCCCACPPWSFFLPLHLARWASERISRVGLLLFSLLCNNTLCLSALRSSEELGGRGVFLCTLGRAGVSCQLLLFFRECCSDKRAQALHLGSPALPWRLLPLQRHQFEELNWLNLQVRLDGGVLWTGMTFFKCYYNLTLQSLLIQNLSFRDWEEKYFLKSLLNKIKIFTFKK